MKSFLTYLKEHPKKHPKTKKAIIAILIALCMVGGAAGGYMYMTNTDFGVASNEKQQTKEDEEKAATKEEKAAKEETKKAEEKKETAKADSDKSGSSSESKSSSNSSSSSSSASKSSSNGNSSSSSSSSGSYSGSSSSSSGSSSSSSGGSSSSKPSKPAHQHSWKPVYGTKKVPYEVDEGHYAMICGNCGAENPSDDHMYNHWIHNENKGTREEWVPKIVTKYKTEKYKKYYKCSCGATK